MRYTLNDIELNLTAGVLIKDGQTISIRAKTLSVLKYLIKHQDKVVSKQEILAIVWHDVVVQEQVLVQSIKEIRDLLGSHIIKTYPRQGYQWTAELQPLTNKKTLRTLFNQPNHLILLVALVLAIILIGFGYHLSTNNSAKNNPDTFTVAFLPVINDMPDDIHDWVPLQGMDYLRETLSQNSQLTVTEPTQAAIATNDLTDIAKTLGTNLVVQTRLLGYPQDFQLQYSLHLTHSIERGVIFSQSVGGAFDQLIEKITLRFDPLPSNSLNVVVTNAPNNTSKKIKPYISDFSNEAFARGIEHYLQRQYRQAISFFSSALQSNNHLLAARRYLAASYINSGKVEQGIALMKENIQQAALKQDHREEIRSNLMMGVLLINWSEESTKSNNNLAEAELYIQASKVLAKQYQDLLFSAYAHEELAKIKRLQQQYPQAVALLNKALQLHQEFPSDYGQTRPLIELALVANAQGNNQQADDYFAQATVIANKNGVATNKVAILLAKAQLQQSHGKTFVAQQSAQQAMNIAQRANSNILIARVNDWIDNNGRYEIN